MQSLNFPIFTLFTYVCACCFCWQTFEILGHDFRFNVFICSSLVMECGKIFSSETNKFCPTYWYITQRDTFCHRLIKKKYWSFVYILPFKQTKIISITTIGWICLKFGGKLNTIISCLNQSSFPVRGVFFFDDFLYQISIKMQIFSPNI